MKMLRACFENRTGKGLRARQGGRQGKAGRRRIFARNLQPRSNAASRPAPPQDRPGYFQNRLSVSPSQTEFRRKSREGQNYFRASFENRRAWGKASDAKPQLWAAIRNAPPHYMCGKTWWQNAWAWFRPSRPRNNVCNISPGPSLALLAPAQLSHRGLFRPESPYPPLITPFQPRSWKIKLLCGTGVVFNRGCYE